MKTYVPFDILMDIHTNNKTEKIFWIVLLFLLGFFNNNTYKKIICGWFVYTHTSIYANCFKLNDNFLFALLIM